MSPAECRSPILLSIAGSDSSAGAGVQADLKTAMSLDMHCCTVVTAVTAQNSQHVKHVLETGIDNLSAQLHAVTEDFNIGAIKIGLLASKDQISVVSEFLSKIKECPIVIDTVLSASVGHAFLNKSSIDEYWSLLKLATIITPNLPECAMLLDGYEANSERAMRVQAQQILDRGANAVLLKGGHLGSEQLSDILARQDHAIKTFTHRKIASKHTHGTGCTLSSALAVYLARGCELAEASQRAIAYTGRALQRGANKCWVKTGGPLWHKE